MKKYFLELYSLNFSNKIRELVNPFTNEKSIAYLDDGFTAIEQNDIEEYFIKLGDDAVDADGYRKIEFGSNNQVRSRDFGFPDGVPAAAIAMEYELVEISFCEMLYHFMFHQNCVVRVGVNAVACSSESSKDILSERWNNISKVESPSDLCQWLDLNKSNLD